MTSILLIEDDEDFAFGLTRLLQGEGFEVHRVASGAEAQASRTLHDLVILDLGLPDMEGLDLLGELIHRDPTTPVIVGTGRDEASLAVKAIRLGASDYLVKPVAPELLFACVASALERATLKRSLEAHRRKQDAETVMVGSSRAMQDTLQRLRQAASAPKAPVLITGETGTGKELAASLVHRLSPRSEGPFVTANASCLPRELVESELFGHESGAFTSARAARRGLFELASKGTLFLDEIGELPLDLQPKLLRVLEGHPFRRVGGERDISCDVRIVAATHRDLKAMVREGRFREDLYFRLRVLEITLPPLRERMEDLPELVAHALSRLAPAQAGEALDPGFIPALRAYDWPGNVRELANALESAVILAGGRPLAPGHLPADLRSGAREASRARSQSAAPLRDLVDAHVVSAWMESGKNLTQTASRLGISRLTLRQKLRKAGVYPDQN